MLEKNGESFHKRKSWSLKMMPGVSGAVNWKGCQQRRPLLIISNKLKIRY